MGIVYSCGIFVINKCLVQKEPSTEAGSLHALKKLQKQIAIVVVFIFPLGAMSSLLSE